MEKGGHGKARALGEARRWLGSGAESPGVLTFPALRLEAPDSSGRTSHFPAGR